MDNLFKKNKKIMVSDILAGTEAGEGSIKDNMDDLCDILEEEILKSNGTEEEKAGMLKRLRALYNTETNIMLVGATGCGKSSTINALFSCRKEIFEDPDEFEELDENEKKEKKYKYVEVAKVGTRSEPETRDIEKYKLGKLILWDTPGLGDGTEIDEHHKSVITELLREKDKDGNALIDLVLIILDGSTRDFGTPYKIINEVIIPELNGETDRILVALNQADIAMKTGRHWDYDKNEPDETLTQFLEEKVNSIKERIKTDSDIDVDPVYYCAGYEEDENVVVYPYNLSKLLYYVLEKMPEAKRIAIMEGINTDSNNYRYNDKKKNYNEKISDYFCNVLLFIWEGVDSGSNIGKSILGIPGSLLGSVIGGVVGCIKGILDGIFG